MPSRRDVLRLSSALAILPLGPLGAATQVAGVYRRSVGEATVTCLLDGWLGLDPAMLNGVDAAEAEALLAESFRAAGPVPTSINAFVVETPDRTVAIDSGGGPHFIDTGGNHARLLEVAGIDPAAVDTVFATHLHPDHIGGLADDFGDPLFPEATLVLHEADHAFWTDDANFADAPDMAKAFAQGAQRAVGLYDGALELVGDGHALTPELTVMHLPGHTPGHSGLMLSSGDESLLLWADIVHMGAVQFARPEVTIPFDVDPEQAAATRARALDMAATDRLEVAGAHVGFPGLGHVARAGSGYRLRPSHWEYAL